MAFERELHRAASGEEGLDLDLEREKAARLKRKRDAELAARVPGKRTLVEQLPVPPEAPASVLEYRARGMRDVVSTMGAIARGERSGLLQTTPAMGETMMRVADRRAHTLMRRAQDHGDVDAHDPAVEESLAQMGGGAPLPEKLRKKMEAEFGVSFDRVRVHTDGVAAQAAAAVHAEAFTVGEDIFFAEGAFDPSSKSGQHLIAHELTHVVQGMEGRVAAAGGVSKPGESLETEAERRAENVVARGSTPRVAPVRPQHVEAPRAPRTVVVAPAPAAAPGVHSAPIMRRPAAGAAPTKKGKGKGKITVQATRDPNDKIPHIQHEGRAKLGEAKSRLDQATHGAKAHAKNAIAQAHSAASAPAPAANHGDEHKDLAHAAHKGHEHVNKAHHAPHHQAAHHDEGKSGDKNAGTGGIKLKPVGDWEKLAPPALPDQDEREKKKILGLVKHKVEKDRAKSAKLLSSLKAAQLKASSGIAAMKGGLQSEIAGAQRAALGKVSSAEAAQVAAVQSHIAGLQAQVRGAASAAVASVDQAHQQTIAQMAQAFAQANQKLAQDHTQALAKLQAETTAELTAVSTQFEEAESSIRAYGGQKASEASAMGDMALSYSGDQLEAARKAAHEVAEKYAAAMPENANQAAELVGKSLPDAQDAVRHTSDAFKEQIETAFNQAKDALQTQHQQMVQAANQAHQQSVSSIRQASSGAISALGALQSQTVAGLHSQAANARAGISSAGAAAIAGVGSTCDKAAAGLKGGAEGVIQAAAKMETPDPKKLGLEVAKARKELSKGAAAAAAGMKKSASSSAASLAQQATSAAGGLAQAASAANTSANQQAQAAEQGIRQTAQQATQAQHKIGEEFKKSSTKLVTQTQTGFEQANEQAKTSFEKQTTTLEGKLKGFVDGCKGKLDEAVPGKERPDILAQAAKAAASVPKHWWQKVVSFVVKVVIAVAIGVAVGALIVATGGVGGVLLAVAIGAAGGALGYTASLVAGNLIEGKAAFDNFSWKGLAVAAVAGGLTAGATSALGSLASGATSGFLGAFAEGASGLGNFAIKTATDFGISMVSDAIAQKAITGEYKVTLEDVLLTAATAGISNSTKLVGGAHEGGREGGGEHGGGAGDLDVGGGHGGEGGSNEGGHGGGSNETQHAGGANDNAAGAKGGADEAKSGGGAGETNAKGANEGAANDNAGAGKGGKGGADEAKAGANDNANAKGAGENKGGANEKTGGGEKGGADEAKSGTNEKGGGENKSNSNEKGKTGGEDEKAGANDKSNANDKGANDNEKGKGGGEDEKAGANDKSNANDKGANENKSGSNEKGKAGEDEKAGANDNGKDKAANDNEKGKGGEDEKAGGDKSESNKKGEHEGNEDQKEGGEGEGGKKKVFDKHKAHEKLDEALHPKTKGQKLEDVAKVGEKTSDVLKDKGREDAEEKKKEKEEEEKSEKEIEEHSHPEMPELEISEKELEEDGYAAANPSTFARAVGSIASGRAPDLKELRDTQANREGRAELEKILSNPNLSPEQKQKLQADLAARLSNGAAPSGNIKRELAAVRHQEKQAGNEAKDAQENESQETPVQRKATAPAPAGGIQAAAAQGTQGPGGQLPHLDQIQRSFGSHDVSGVHAHVGGAAATASAQLGAEAYAHGNSVAFAAPPDLHTAAHEAAHVVQQRGGVQLKGGIDGGANDPYEQHADAVADAVVAGRSAEPLLATMSGGAQTHGAVQRVAAKTPATAGAPAITPPKAGGNKAGFIDHTDGANLRSGPAEAGGVTVHDGPLPPATRVFISGTHPDAPEWTYVTAFLNGQAVRGYVQGFRITTDLPEPLAKLHQVVSGDTAEKLAVQEYKSSVRDGHDLRYYENVLLYVNKQAGRAGIRGSFQDPGLLGGGGNNVQLEAGHRIWLVSPEFAKELESVVPDGSFSGGLYGKVKRFVQHVRDIVASVTEAPDHFPAVAGEYAQAIRDHMAEIVGITAGFILAEATSMFLAATPTGVGQAAAAVIQLALSAFGAANAIQAGVVALQHGSAWLNTAWTAKGDKAKIAAASVEFLKMLVSIAMAALSAAGAKGNYGNAVKIGNAIDMAPAMAMANGGTQAGAGAGAGVAINPTMSPVGAAGAAMTQHDDSSGGGGHKDASKTNSGAEKPKTNEPAGESKSTAPHDGNKGAAKSEGAGHEAGEVAGAKQEEIAAPSTGAKIDAVARGNALVPRGKVELYPRGKVKPFTAEMAEELKALRHEKQTARKAFDADPSKAERLQDLIDLQKNAKRSAEMAQTLEEAGLPDTPANNEKIIEHLLEVGEKVTPDHLVDVRSELVGPAGKVKVLSTWKLLPDGRVYLSTVKLIPMT